MNNFEHILETCVDLIAGGRASVDQCLADYPAYRDELKPLLQAAAKVAGLQSIEPSAEFRHRGRRALDAHMRANPRSDHRSNFFAELISNRAPTRRLVTALAVVLLALVSTSTVLAQGSLPGDPLYGWKLQTEQLWRPFTSEKTQYELQLAERRAYEVVAVYQQPDLALSALENYKKSLFQILTELEERPDQVLTVYEVLLEQQNELIERGIFVPELDAVLRTLTPPETEQPDEQPQDQDGNENSSNGGADSGLGTTVEDPPLDSALATSMPSLLQSIATAVAPILNP